MHAVINEDLENASPLLKRYKANPNIQDRSGWAALHLAAQGNAPEIVEELISAGAVVDSVDDHENTPLFRAVFSYRNGDEAITTLLRRGATPDHPNKHGISPRQLAYNIWNYGAKKFFP